MIYDGVWVGENSKIPNQHGIRNAFIDTMRAVQAPVLRWPGGCFADSYDWRDGIGPRNKRPARTAFWNQQDTNQYGLHEFMRTCRAIGCKPYLAANLRTLPARDFYQEIEYCNAPAGNVPSNSAAPAVPNAFAAQRAANGDITPFNVDLWGVGNESWGCGGNLTPEEYAAEYRRFTAWTPSYSKEPLRFVAVGPNGDDVDWTTRLFKALHANPEQRHLWGLSIHYYTSGSPSEFAAGDALKFNDAELLRSAHPRQHHGARRHRSLEGHRQHSRANGQVKLVVDEWGAWYGKGTELAPQYNLSQQSTMRDALLTGITLDIFQRHAEKVAVANVAQSINCIHSLMLAQEDKFTVTPTFHVFQMYLPHRGAQAVRAEFTAPTIANPLANAPIPVGGNSYIGSLDAVKTLAGLSGSASIAETATASCSRLASSIRTSTAPSPPRSPCVEPALHPQKALCSPATTSTTTTTSRHPDAVKPAAATVGRLQRVVCSILFRQRALQLYNSRSRLIALHLIHKLTRVELPPIQLVCEVICEVIHDSSLRRPFLFYRHRVCLWPGLQLQGRLQRRIARLHQVGHRCHSIRRPHTGTDRRRSSQCRVHPLEHHYASLFRGRGPSYPRFARDARQTEEASCRLYLDVLQPARRPRLAVHRQRVSRNSSRHFKESPVDKPRILRHNGERLSPRSSPQMPIRSMPGRCRVIG